MSSADTIGLNDGMRSCLELERVLEVNDRTD
jgi:hypothetical protein